MGGGHLYLGNLSINGDQSAYVDGMYRKLKQVKAVYSITYMYLLVASTSTDINQVISFTSARPYRRPQVICRAWL